MKACEGHFYSSLADIINVLSAWNLVGFSNCNYEHARDAKAWSSNEV